MSQFVRKGFGRIFVRRPEDVAVVEEGIRAVDEYEWHYFSPEIIHVLATDERPRLVYTHKFEIDMDALTLWCWRRGVAIWCVSQYGEEWEPEGWMRKDGAA